MFAVLKRKTFAHLLGDFGREHVSVESSYNVAETRPSSQGAARSACSC